MSNFVSIDFCCNNPDNGMFTGRFDSVSIGNGVLHIDNQYSPPRAPKLQYDFALSEDRGFDAASAIGRIKVSRRWFPVHGYKYGWGNWCWDMVLMAPADAIRLLNYLREMNLFRIDSGFTKWCDRWDAGEFTEDKATLADLEEYGRARP